MKWRVVIVVVLLVVACRVMADGSAGQQAVLTTDLTGTLGGTAYKIRVPENWNGTLLVFAHPHQLTGPQPWPAPQVPGFEQQLLDMGYALAGSAFLNSNKDGVVRTHQLTEFFRETVANPRRIIIWGNSFGAGVALALIEKYPGVYDGAIANCSPSAGNVENMDSALAFSLAYDAAIGWREDLWGPVENVRDDLTVDDVLPVVPWPPDGARPPEWEFIRLVMHLPEAAFWTKDPGSGGWEFYKLQMWKATVLRSAAEQENGGPVAENIGTRYTVDEDDATLASVGLTREWVDQNLAYMNAHANIAADKAARSQLAHWGAPTGQLRRPVLTMHCKDDGMAFVTTENYYKALVETAGAEGLLVQTYVNRLGHCTFTPDQYKSALGAMNHWLDTGVRPDASFFPAAKGFDFGFTPGPWIF